MFNWRFTDSEETLVSTLDHAALTYVRGKSDPAADASATTTRAVFNAIVLRQRTFDDARQKGELSVAGNAAKLDRVDVVLRRLRPGVQHHRTLIGGSESAMGSRLWADHVRAAHGREPEA